MIRLANKSDISAINELGKQLHDNYEKLFNIERILDDSYSKVLVYETDGMIVGFLHIEEHYEITDIINIVVDTLYRNKHIASSLIDELLKTIDLSTNKILLEVRIDNSPAINLYKKYNFQQINIRKKYYNGTDALIMERTI